MREDVDLSAAENKKRNRETEAAKWGLMDL